MTAQESISIFEDMAATFVQAVASLVVSISDNVSVSTTGLRSNVMIMRTASRGLADNVDEGIWVKTSVFSDVSLLRGRTAVVTYGGVEKTMRIVATKEHALGGLVLLQFGEYDRVIQ